MEYLFVDKIIDIDLGKTTRGIKTITESEFYLTSCDNFKEKYFMPALIGEALGQLTAWNVMKHLNFRMRPVAGIATGAQMIRPVYVGETLALHSTIDYLDDEMVQYHGQALVNDEPVFSLKNALGPLLPMSDFIEVNKVTQQFTDLFNDEAKLRTKPQFTELDDSLSDIIDFNKGQNLVVNKKIDKKAPFFLEHFPLKPVLPMTMLLEFKRKLGDLFFKKSGYTENFVILEFKKVKMTDFILPDSTITCALKVGKIINGVADVTFTTTVNDKRVCVANAIYGAREAS